MQMTGYLKVLTVGEKGGGGKSDVHSCTNHKKTKTKQKKTLWPLVLHSPLNAGALSDNLH